MTTRVVLLVDIGSTFTKVASVALSGELVSRVVVPTRHDDLAAGADAAVVEAVPPGASATEVLMCSSAAGGLRVAVIGLEPRLTLEAGRRAAATAGARIVASFAGVLDAEEADALRNLAPDVVLLAGGTDGGDQTAVAANARRVSEVLPATVPVVVAGNEQVSREIAASIGGNGRIVRLVANVLPRIGEIEVNAAQGAIRELFVEHVIGRGRFASASPAAAAIRMPTPSAVLAGTQALARLGGSDPRVRAPVVVDVGGATTDVHSVQPIGACPRGQRDLVPNVETTRTVEGDLGLRENAETLVEEAIRSGYTDRGEDGPLREAAARRAANRTFVPVTGAEAEEERRLAILAAAMALSRHAGKLSIRLSPSGATIRHTGRDLRAATCLVATGGVFEAAADPVAIIEAALAAARRRGALVPDDVPTFVDRQHVLAGAGLLAERHPSLAAVLLRRAFTAGGLEHAG
jgi:uncharacterized protein (TIGR01319 family)